MPKKNSKECKLCAWLEKLNPNNWSNLQAWIGGFVFILPIMAIQWNFPKLYASDDIYTLFAFIVLLHFLFLFLWWMLIDYLEELHWKKYYLQIIFRIFALPLKILLVAAVVIFLNKYSSKAFSEMIWCYLVVIFAIISIYIFIMKDYFHLSPQKVGRYIFNYTILLSLFYISCGIISPNVPFLYIFPFWFLNEFLQKFKYRRIFLSIFIAEVAFAYLCVETAKLFY